MADRRRIVHVLNNLVFQRRYVLARVHTGPGTAVCDSVYGTVSVSYDRIKELIAPRLAWFPRLTDSSCAYTLWPTTCM